MVLSEEGERKEGNYVINRGQVNVDQVFWSESVLRYPCADIQLWCHKLVRCYSTPRQCGVSLAAPALSLLTSLGPISYYYCSVWAPCFP